jgi:hypothetical protein
MEKEAEIVPLGCPICNRQPSENHSKYWTGMRSVIAMYRLRCIEDPDHKLEVRGKTLNECITNWNTRSNNHGKASD